LSRYALVGLLGVGLLGGCGKYRDFTLPEQPGGPSVAWKWQARDQPVLSRGNPGEWDAVDVLNPSVVRQGEDYYNFFSGYDGKTWHTGLAVSADGVSWRNEGKILSPKNGTWESGAIAANGSALSDGSGILYYYQAGDPVQIGLARSSDGHAWRRNGAPVLTAGPYGSWDERGVADPYVIRAGSNYYMFYLGMDRALRQRLGVAESQDGVSWYKLRTNPVMELGEYGTFDAKGLGEPAVWVARGYYWMLYTGRARGEVRRLGLARSRDGVRWEKLPVVIAGEQAWDSKVICDPTVIASGDRVTVWFGGGDVAGPDQNIDGQIGLATLTAEPQNEPRP
jgi:predicted GH43/DUF377 family glycosyl hydrolase